MSSFFYLRAFGSLVGRTQPIALHARLLSTRHFSTPPIMSSIPKYPVAPRSDTVNIYKSEKQGEVKVPDPYDKLQETNEQTTRWIDENNTITRGFLDSNPDRQPLEDAIRKNWNYPKVCFWCLLRVVAQLTWQSFLHPI